MSSAPLRNAPRSVSICTITVAVGESDPLVARGLSELIADDPDMAVVAAEGDRDALLTAIDRHDPDVVVCSPRLRPTRQDEGLQVLRHLRSTRSRAGFLLLEQDADHRVAAAVLQGAERGRGCLLRSRLSDAAELRTSIRAIAAGATVIDPELVARLSGESATAALDGLSPREREVLALIAEGLSNDGIAARLSISEAAVEKRATSLFRKLPLEDSPRVNRRVAAALLYLATR